MGLNIFDRRGRHSRTHGEGGPGLVTAEYTAWQQMKDRCYNPNSTSFQHYGRRGITVCERWIGSYQDFLSDMGRRPSQLHSLDRIDVNGNYKPSNCRWATKKEQGRNQRTNHLLSCDGETWPAVVWAERLGVNVAVIYERLKHGWSVLDAVTTPARKYSRKAA